MQDSRSSISFCIFDYNSTNLEGGAVAMLKSAPYLTNLLIYQNHATRGAGLYCLDSEPVMKNLTIVRNNAVDDGGAIAIQKCSSVSIRNSIIWDNSATTGASIALIESDSYKVNLFCSNIDTSKTGAVFATNASISEQTFRWHPSNLSADPLFLDAEKNDFRIKSTSPCVDGGFPLDEIGDEVFPHGYCVNMGAYGSTVHAAITDNPGLVLSPNSLQLKSRDIGDEITCYIRNATSGPIEISEIFLSSREHFEISGFSDIEHKLAQGRVMHAGEIDSLKILFRPQNALLKNVSTELILKSNTQADKIVTITGQTVKENPKLAESDRQIPLTFELHQNYPNPFNNTTTIRFSIPESGFVSLKVFNMLGQTVATLISRDMASGSHSIKWNATGLSSGRYIYRISSGGAVRTKSMTLLQ
jgi:hypothetical protein